MIHDYENDSSTFKIITDNAKNTYNSVNLIQLMTRKLTKVWTLFGKWLENKWKCEPYKGSKSGLQVSIKDKNKFSFLCQVSYNYLERMEMLGKVKYVYNILVQKIK